MIEVSSPNRNCHSQSLTKRSDKCTGNIYVKRTLARRTSVCMHVLSPTQFVRVLSVYVWKRLMSRAAQSGWFSVELCFMVNACCDHSTGKHTLWLVCTRVRVYVCVCISVCSMYERVETKRENRCKTETEKKEKTKLIKKNLNFIWTIY